MKRITKHVIVWMVVGAVSTASLFAVGPKGGKDNDRPNPQNQARQEEDLRELPPHGRPDFIGKVKSVDASKGVLVLTKADGKDVTVQVSPFTKVMVQSEGELPPPPSKNDKKKQPDRDNPPQGEKRPGLSEVKAGDWAAVSVFRTDSDVPDAERIMILRNND